jgi:hypothetical protein
MKAVLALFIIIAVTTIIVPMEIYAQIEDSQQEQGSNTEGSSTNMTKELSCEFIPDSGLLCGNSEIGLCVLRTDLTDVGGGKMWNLVSTMLCEAGE